MLYLDWFNAMARASFLRDGAHREMFFFISEEGDIDGCQFRDGLESSKKNAIISEQAEKLKPFGTLHVRIVDAAPINSSAEKIGKPEKCLWLELNLDWATTGTWSAP